MPEIKSSMKKQKNSSRRSNGKSISHEKTKNKNKKRMETKRIKKEEQIDENMTKWRQNLSDLVSAKATAFVKRYFNMNRNTHFIMDDDQINEKDEKKEKKHKEMKIDNVDDLDEVGFYHNIDLEMLSPPLETPRLPSDNKFLMDVYENSAPRYVAKAEKRSISFLTISCVNICAIVSLPFVMMRFGGFYFLIPFILSTIFVTTPINIFQHFLGQFTSLPPSVLFYRMSPAFAGIGALVTILQFLAFGSIRTEHRFTTILLEFFESVFVDKVALVRPIQSDGVLNQYFDYCEEGSTFYKGRCWRNSHLNFVFMPLKDYYKILVNRYIQSNPEILEEINQRLNPEVFFNENLDQTNFNNSVFLTILIFFCFSVRGLSHYGGKMTSFVYNSAIIYSIFYMFYIIIRWRYNASIYIQVVGADFNKLFHFRTWIIGLIHSLSIFSTIDGTHYSMGLISDFKYNFVRQLIIQTLTSIPIVLLLSTVFGTSTVIGIIIDHYSIRKRDMVASEIRNLIFKSSDVYKYMFIFLQSDFIIYWGGLFFSVIFILWQIAGQMVFSQSTVITMQHLFRTMIRLPEKLTVYIIVVIHFTLISATYLLTSRKSRADALYIAPISIFLQLLTISIFSVKRFLPCIYTIYSEKRYIIRDNRYFLKWIFQIFLPTTLFIAAFYDFVVKGFYNIKMASLPVIIVSLHQILYVYYLRKSFWRSFVPTAKFGPAFLIDRQEYIRNIRGARQDN